MTSSHRAAVFLLLAAVIPISAAADPIIVFTSLRSAQAGVVVGPYVPNGTPSGVNGTEQIVRDSDVLTATANMTNQYGTATGAASLTSQISSLALTGTSSVVASKISPEVSSGAQGLTDYTVGFTVTAPTSFQFDADFRAFGGSDVLGPQLGWWGASLDSWPGSPDSTVWFDYSGSDARHISLTGLLAPGDYRFSVDLEALAEQFGPDLSTAYANGSFRFAVDSTATPTPEPASLLLLGTGAVGLFARRRVRPQRA